MAHSGDSAPPIELVVGVSPDAGPAIITNTASVDGPLVDPNPDNDVDDDPTTVNDLANVTKEFVSELQIDGKP